MTTEDTGETCILSGSVPICGQSLDVQENLDFFPLVIMKSVTADGSLRSPTGGVKGLNPAPHIHEPKTTSNYV